MVVEDVVQRFRKDVTREQATDLVSEIVVDAGVDRYRRWMWLLDVSLRFERAVRATMMDGNGTVMAVGWSKKMVEKEREEEKGSRDLLLEGWQSGGYESGPLGGRWDEVSSACWVPGYWCRGLQGQRATTAGEKTEGERRGGERSRR